MRFLAAALIVVRFGGSENGVEDTPCDFLAAHRAFIASEICFLAAALSTLRFRGAYALPGGLSRLAPPPSRAAMAVLKRSRSIFSSVRILSRVKMSSYQGSVYSGWSIRTVKVRV